MAEMFLKVGNNDKAIESARLAVQHDATLAAAHSVLGESLRAAGNCKDAVPAFNKALTIDPKDERAVAGKKACAGKAP